MKVLLDTHALLWFIMDDAKLSSNAIETITKSEHVLVSIVSLWEIAIKLSIGKLSLDGTFEQLFPQQLHTNDFHLLPIRTDHITHITALPFHHRDPFDRLLIAQAIEENIAIVSRDSAFNAYNVIRLW